jgi:hypothetical protein
MRELILYVTETECVVWVEWRGRGSREYWKGNWKDTGKGKGRALKWVMVGGQMGFGFPGQPRRDVGTPGKISQSIT